MATHSPDAQRAFVEAGLLANTETLYAGQVDENVERNPFDTDRWLPQAQDIARRLPQIIAAQAAVATTQSATVAAIATPTAAQIAAGGGGGFGVSAGTGGGLSGVFGQIVGGIGAADYVKQTAGGIADFFAAPGQASAGGDALSAYRGIQQSALEQQRPSQEANSILRQYFFHPVDEAKRIAEGIGTLIFGSAGPGDHGTKPAQGN